MVYTLGRFKNTSIFHIKKLIVIVFFLSQPCFANQDIKVMGLFNGKAFLQINGENKLISQGDSFKGITLIQATSRFAKIKQTDGSIHELKMGSSIGSNYKKPELKSLKIYPNSIGM